ncbi:MAG: PQQ-binding-like beta-propeller repeat protein [Phycisphaeraceae bacterium]
MRTARDKTLNGPFVISLLSLLFITACGREQVATAQTDDWPSFRGPAGQGVSQSKVAPPVEFGDSKNIAWKTPLPGPGGSSPIVWSDRIYITCWTGYNVPGESGGSQEKLQRHLIALRRDNGKEIWSVPIKATLPEQDKIREEHGYASSTPAADKAGVVCFFGKSGVYAFDHQGKQQWHAEVGSTIHGWGSAASPVLYSDLVIINASVESESLIALNRKTGEKAWSVRGIKESWNTPILVDVGGKKELIVAIMGKIFGITPETGEQLWSCDTDIGWYMVPSLVAHEGVVYALGGRSGVAGLAVRAGGKGDVTGSRRLWTSKKGSNVTSPIYSAGHLYWMHDNLGIAYCAKAETGEIVYDKRIERAGQVYGSPVLANGLLYYPTREGRTYVIAARPEFELVATNELERRGTFNGCPAVVDGKLLIRSDKFLYCMSSE